MTWNDLDSGSGAPHIVQAQDSGPWGGSRGGSGTPGGPLGSPPLGGKTQGNDNRGPGNNQAPGNKGEDPQDIDEWLRRTGDHLRRILPGGLPGGGHGPSRFAGLAVLVVVLLWLASGFYTVQQSQQGVVLLFGECVRTVEPGLRYHLPWPIETVLTPEVMRSNRIEIGLRPDATTDQSDVDGSAGGSAGGNGAAASTDLTPDTDQQGHAVAPDEPMMLTGDENIVDISFTVLWQIKDARQFLFGIRDPESTVRKAAQSAMREVIGKMDIQAALTGARSEIESDVRNRLQSMMDEYGAGIQINQVQLQRVDPPPAVVDAFNDVQRARADMERLSNEAETYRNDIIPKAHGDAERLTQEAEGYKEQVIDLAQGEAQRFSSVYDSYRNAKDVIARRMYLETMEQVLRNSTKIIIDGDSKGGGLGATPLISLGDFMRQQTGGGASVGAQGAGGGAASNADAPPVVQPSLSQTTPGTVLPANGGILLKGMGGVAQ